MAKIEPELLEDQTPTGFFDTDRGGRQPDRRDEIRLVIRAMRDLADGGWNDTWRLLTTQDGLVIAQILSRLALQNARLLRVRVTQSHSARRRGNHRG